MDLRLRWGIQGADLEIEGGDLAIDEGLVTPALVSLFSDGRVAREVGASPELQDLRGWWAEDPTDPFGSLLWTLARAKMTDETLERARGQAQDALRWLVQGGIAASVTVTSTRISREVLGLEIELRRGPSSVWSSLWDATEGTRVDTGGILLDFTAR